MNIETTIPAEPFIPPAPVEKVRGPALLPVALIDASGRRRPINEAAVAQLADSIEAAGLITPILVRPSGDGFKLVVGGHRLAAMKQLGRDEIPSDVRELDDDDALKLELDENLARHELDIVDFGDFCIERKALDARIAQRQKEGGDRRSAAARSLRQVGEVIPRFTAELAERIGRSERTIQRAIKIVKSLDAETLSIVRCTPVANNASRLIELGREQNLNLRRNAAQRMVSGEAKTVQDAKIQLGLEEEIKEDPQKTYLGQLERAWDLASLYTRECFLMSIDAASLTAPKKEPDMTPEMRRALDMDRPAPSHAPSRGGRRSGKGVAR